HGQPRKGFTPMFESGHSKGLPGGDETVNYPGDYHYLARAIIQSGKTGIPLLNDIPGLKLPGMLDIAPQDDAKLLAGILAVECTRIALPPTPLLRPEDIMEFREAALAGRRQWRLFRKGRRPSRNYRPIKVEDYSGDGRPGCGVVAKGEAEIGVAQTSEI